MLGAMMSLQIIQSEALKNLNFQKDCERMVASSVERGLEEWPAIYRKALEDFKKEPINIGVTGSSGAGKSSWINSMCHFKKGSSDQYAATDVIECTKEIKAFRHPEIGNTWFWDMPGVNTPNYPRDTYLKKVMFEQYDALIIINKDRFTDDDLYLSKVAEEHGIPYYFVYSQFDIKIYSAEKMNTNETENEIKLKICEKFNTELSKAELGTKKIYFISNLPESRQKYDFQELEKQIKNDIKHNSNRKRGRLQASLKTIVQNMIDDKLGKVRDIEICDTTKDKPDDEAYKKLKELTVWFGLRNTEKCLQDIRQCMDKIIANTSSVKDKFNAAVGVGNKAVFLAGVGATVELAASTVGAGAAAGLAATAGSAAVVGGGVVMAGAALGGGTLLGVTHLMKKKENSKLYRYISRRYNKICEYIETKACDFKIKEIGEVV